MAQEEELARLVQKAEEGDVQAQCMLADMYALGLAGEEEEKVVYWNKKAAEQGYT